MVAAISTWIFISAFSVQFYAVGSSHHGTHQKRIEQPRDFLDLGRASLAKGHFSEALRHFHAAVERNPNNYVAYHERANAYLGLAKSKSAIKDLNKVLELKPNFLLARLQRGSVLLKQGKLDEAHMDFEAVLRKEPRNSEALRQYNSIDALSRKIQNAQRLLHQSFYRLAVAELSQIIEVCPWDPKLREMRAEGYIHLDDLTMAISDIQLTTKLINDNTDAYFKLSNLHYQLGEAEESLTQIRSCLKFDPEHKSCLPFYKKVKKLNEQIKHIRQLIGKSWYKTCVKKAHLMLEMESEVALFVFKAKAFMCHCLTKAENAPMAVQVCSQALEIEESAPVYCDRAEAYILLELFNNASADYQRALDIDERSRRAEESREHLPELITQSKTTNYYKILGVTNDAGTQEILKSYRKLAQRWHPDRFQDSSMKEYAEKKFLNIAAAKEVLTDPDKRSEYDNRLARESQGW